MTKSGKIHTFPLFALTLILIGILCPLGAFAATRADFGPLKAASIQIISIKLLGNEAFFIPPGETGQLEAETYPENLKEEIRWAVTGRNGDVDVELDPRTGFLTISENSGSGWIRVQAEAERCRPRTQRIEIGCGCAGGSGQCHLIAGAGNVANGSIDVRISFGKTREGRWAGDLFLFAKEPLAELSTPEALFINSTSDQVIPLYRDDILEQIVTPQTIITFARFSPQEYEIYFYDIAERGQQLENGLYSIDLTAEPMAIWRIENPDGSGETVDQLAVTEIRGGKQRNFLYVYTAGEKGWTLVSDSGRKIDVKKETTDDDGDRVARRVISGADNEPVSVEETVYHQFEFGEKRIRKVIDPDGAGLTTAYHYETSRGPGYGKLKARTDADGSWVRYEYDETGRIVQEIKPFLDAGIDAPAEKTVVVTRSYAAVDAADSRAERDRYRPRRVIEAINGIETARTYYVYIKEADDSRTEITERCTGQGKSYGDSTNLRTEASYYGTKVKSPASGKIKSSLSADGRLATYTYENGQFRLSPDPARSFFIPGKGKALRTTVTHGTAKHPEGLPFQTTRETTITDSLGQEKMQETFVRTEAGDERIGWQFNAHNRLGQLTETLYANRTRTEIEWGCCGKVSTTDVSGITTRYTYDDLKRVTARINEATGVVTAYTYDAVGRRLTSTEKKDDLSRTQESRYDRAGRLVAQVDAAGLVTRHSTDKTISTTIRPGGATEITTRHLDGRIHASTGTAVVPRFYRYGVNRDGRRWTTVFVGDQDSPRWEKTTRDVAGRIIKVEKPGFTGLDVTTNAYDRFGRIIRTTSSGTGGMLHIYDALGSRIQSGLDVDGDGKLTPASMDRISTEISAYTRIEGDWWHEQKSAIYAHDSSDKKTTVSIRRSRLSGWKDQLIAEDLAIDIHGNETRRFEFLDRFNRKRIQTTHFADSEFSAQSIIIDGRPVESTSQTGLTVRYGYDALGRRNAVMEPRTGLSTLGYDEKGRIAYREDAAGNRTRYVYDPASGQKTAEYNPHGQASRYAYDAKGRLTRTWGDVPYPVEYAFGPYGEMVSMQTFRSGAGWKGKNWPADTGPPDTTRWHYQAETGLLLAKEDAGGNQTIYAYGAGNRLTRRTWARPVDGQALFTRYSYNDKTGDLKKVDYSDDTVDIEFLYDRTGRRKQIIDAGGTRTFQYNRNLQLASENLAGRLSYRMERAYDALGRNAGFALDAQYGITYTYDPAGRFKSVRWQVNHQRGQADYSYRKDSNLLTGLSMNAGVRVFYDYEPHRNRRSAVTNKFNDKLISRYEYQYDRLGRRINVKNSGEAVEKEGFWLYGYNDRNELTAASRFAGQELADQTNPLLAQERIYNYDPIGNRTSSIRGNETTAYEANRLNQYDSIAKTDKKQGRHNDRDGNLIKDERFKYTWNAENRLVAVEPVNAKTGDKKTGFVYDYIGRRICKKVYRYQEDGYKLSDTIHFVYNGWNLIREVHQSNGQDPVDTSYVWGLDLSQTRQGAGGVGGLIARIEGSLTYHYLYDANGNVVQLVNSVSGAVAATYEYDPFGNTDSFHESVHNAFRFSTKFFDTETDLYCYGNRYYNSKQGRWYGKDPLGEQGGLNLYGFLSNDPVNLIDPYGLFSWCKCSREAFVGMGAGVRDIATGFWDLLTTNPITTAGQMCDAVWGLVQEVRNENFGAVGEALFPDIYILSTRWEELEEKRCYYVGKIASEYGVSIASGAASAKIVSILKKLKAANGGIRLLTQSDLDFIAPKNVSHGPMNPGPLADDIANTFRSGTYTAKSVDKSTTMYRVISDTGNPTGSYWTRVKQKGPLQSAIDSALDQNWGNTATRVVEAKIPVGTKIYEGTAAAQRGLVGGGNQVYIPKFDPKWIVP